jgi:hypothetical protein
MTLAAAVTLAGAAPALAQCAMCRSAVTSSPEGQAMGAELNAAILVMLAAPYAVFGSIATILFRHRLQEAFGPRVGAVRRTLLRLWRG